MATEKYLCRQCKIITEFDKRRKTHPCPYCSRDLLFPMHAPELLGGCIRKGNHPYYGDILEIPDGAKECESSVYCGSSMKEIIFPATLEKISAFCFSECNFLNKVIIPGTVKEVGSHAFSNCDALEEVILEDGVEIISDSAFDHCENLKRVVIPGTVKNIAYSTFFLCRSLENVILGEGVESIEKFAFSCCKLQSVMLPVSVKKITHAFDRFKLVRLHSEITELDEDAFDRCDDSCQFVVTRNSYAEKFLKRKGFKYEVLSGGPGILSDNPVVDGALYWVAAKNGKIVVPSGVKIIEEYVATDHGCPTEIILPESARIIKAHAFFDCTSLEKVSFGSKIVRIGSMAFVGLRDQLIDLPKTVEELAQDAFGKGCVVSIAGKMPFYQEKCEVFENRQKEFPEKERAIKNLQRNKQSLETDLDSYTKAMPQEFAQIPQLKSQIRETTKKQAEYKQITAEKEAVLTAQIDQLEADIIKLSEQRKKCSLFALSRKKELKAQIDSMQNELEKLLDLHKELSSEAATAEALFTSDWKSIKEKMEELQARQKRWEADRQTQLRAISKIAEEVQIHTKELEAQKNTLEKERQDLEREHTRWQEAKDNLLQRKAEEERLRKEAEERLLQQRLEQKRIEDEARALKREQQRKETLRREKAKILSNLVPPRRNDASYIYEQTDAIVEERLLNESFYDMLKKLDEECFVESYNQFISDHSQELDRVREINNQLGLSTEDGIEHYQLMPPPKEAEFKLPQRFEQLTKFFAETKHWKLFNQECKNIVRFKHSKNDIFDSFFAHTEKICLRNDRSILMLLPYCIVKCEIGKPLLVFTYLQAKLSVSYQDIEDEYEKLPAYGELLSERYMHLNLDGSVNKRYKNNPILQTVRFSSGKFSFAHKSFTFPFCSYESALQFSEAFNIYQNALVDGRICDVYDSVIRSADQKNIELKMQAYIEAEQRRSEEEKYRRAAEKRAAKAAAKEEEKRLEAERVAVETAAAEKRKELIQQQKERNEERKKREAEKQRIFSMFEEEPEISTHSPKEQKISHSSPIEIIGKRAITNNVFKINVRQLAAFSSEFATCYFVSSDGTLISNKKKLDNGNIGAESVIGFVLVSEIDYTQMKTCSLCIESDGTIIGEIEFAMNISFYSDF